MSSTRSQALFPARTGLLLATLVALTLAKFPPWEERVRALPVSLPSPAALAAARRHLLDDLLPLAARLRAGERVPDEDGSLPSTREDSSCLLWFLWDDLSPGDRATALEVLGYPPGTSPAQVYGGPHPAWRSRIAWQGDAHPLQDF
jgi:hypothetical protein